MEEKKVICNSGGLFQKAEDGSLSYSGGNAQATCIDNQMTFAEFQIELRELFEHSIGTMSIKYFIPGYFKTLITISNDKGLRRMIQFHGDSDFIELYVMTDEMLPLDVSNMQQCIRQTTLPEAMASADASLNIESHIEVSPMMPPGDPVSAELFRIKKMNFEHNCYKAAATTGHQATSSLVAGFIEEKLKLSPNYYYKIKDIVSDFKQGHGIQITYLQARCAKMKAEKGQRKELWRAKKKADVCDDSSILEVEVLKDGREGRRATSSDVCDDSTPLRSDLSIVGVPVHKTLMKPAEGQCSTKKPAKVIIPQEAFVPLTGEEENEIARVLSPAYRMKVLVTHQNSKIEITGEMLQCLRPGEGLNDEVINVYLELLKEREKREPKKFLRCHFFNTFFYNKLISGNDGYDFKSVRRWTTQRKLGYSLTDCDKIFVPIHKEIHWSLAVINKMDQSFQYLDSLGATDPQVLKNLARYFADEVKDKSGNNYDASTWEQEFVENLPKQQNGFDCGMFMIKYADFYSRGGGLCFNQENMPYFRKRTTKEILRLKVD